MLDRHRFLATIRPLDSVIMPEITQLLIAAAGGDRQAAADLLPLVYDELRKLRGRADGRGVPGAHPRRDRTGA